MKNEHRCCCLDEEEEEKPENIHVETLTWHLWMLNKIYMYNKFFAAKAILCDK